MSPLRLLPIALTLSVAMSGCRPPRPVGDRSWHFPGAGITTVILRASDAPAATVDRSESGEIELDAHPALKSVGYHSREPAATLTPAAEWPFDFTPTSQGSTLVLSSEGEKTFPHHRYVLEKLELRVPAGVAVWRERTPPIRHPERSAAESKDL